MNDAGAGRLEKGSAAPTTGERTQVLAAADGFTVEQILSGRLDAAADYDQDHDEWVVVLDGGAVLTVDGHERTLGPGDWLLLPAHTRHRLVHTDPGTSWLAIRGTRADRNRDRDRADHESGEPGTHDDLRGGRSR